VMKKGYLYPRVPDLDDDSSEDDDQNQRNEDISAPTAAGCCCHSTCVQGCCVPHHTQCCSCHPPPACCNSQPRETVTFEIDEEDCAGDPYRPRSSHKRTIRHTVDRTRHSSHSPSPLRGRSSSLTRHKYRSSTPNRIRYPRSRSRSCSSRPRPRSVHVVTHRYPRQCSRSPRRDHWLRRSPSRYGSSGSVCTLSDDDRDVVWLNRDHQSSTSFQGQQQTYPRPYQVRIATPGAYRTRSVSSPRVEYPRADPYY